MFAAPPEDRFPDESSPTRSKDVTKIKVKKKTDSPKVTLPPLAVRPLLSCSYIHKNTPSDKTLSLLELPQLVPQAEPETKQKEGPLMAAALGAAIPIRRTQLEAERPYDLKVVHYSEAGSDHYIFSPNTVIHVTETGFGGTLSLSEWYRECVLWTALQEIPFIRNFRIKKAFARWKENKRMVSFQRKCKNLQDLLLVAVPQFREALHLFTRVIGELKDTHWMPLDDCKTYTIQEFKKVLMNKNEEYRLKLKKLSQYHLGILNVVKEETYRRHKELQMQLKRAKQQTSCSEPIHLLLAYRHQLKKELCQSEVILRKLGNFAALVHQMITQGLITITKQDAVSFLSLLKRDRSQQCCLFYVELCFTANSRPTVDSAVHEFHKAANESLLTSDNTIVQMCENLGFFQEISSKLCNEDQGLISDSKCVKHSATTGVKKEEVKFQSLRCMLAHQMMQPEANSLKVQGIRVQGCYRPFSKAQLEWHVNIEDVFRKAETEQAKIMQDTELEIQQVCDSFAWLKEIHSFVRQWSPGSLESMKDQPASVYEENIKKLSYWAQKVDAIVSSVNTSNQLFFISCTHTKETLRLQLSRIEKQVVEQLVEQTRLNSENLVFDLERMTAELQTEPQDVQEFAAYALRVRESERMWADMQKRLECILSLHNTICMNCRKMTEQELALKEKMLCLWESFIPILKQADSHVCNSLPSMTNALNTMVSFLVCDLKNTVLKASSGPFLDPSQDAKQMASELNYMCAHVQTLSAKLEEYNRSSQNMQEQPLDLTVLKTDVKKVIERKELWRIKAAYTTWLEEWKQLQLSQLVISQAQEKIVLWKVQTQSLIGIPMNDPVLEEVLKILESLSHQAEVMEKLTNTTLREKHMKMIFQGLGLLFVPENTFSVAEVLSQHPETHQRLIDKICRDAQSEWNMEQRFQRISLRWKDKLFQLDEVIHPACQHCEKQKGLTEEKPNKNTFPCASHCSCDDARFTITGLETLSAEVDNDLITLSIMLKSPQSVEFRLQLEECDQSLQELAKLLKLFESYQQLWAFLSKTFGETSFYDQEVNLLKHFQQVDEAFKELMSTISADLHVLNFVSSEAERFHGVDLWKAVWKSEMDVLLFEHKLDQEVLDLWKNLADDLFSSTFILLGRYNLTSAYGSCNNNGLQAIMSFVRILEALVQHFEKQIENSKTASQKGKRDGSNCPGLDSQNKQDLLTRNLFLVAYIWGFGGHLHSRHWPQFDLLVRQLLFSSRYKILVPDKESVFEQFLGFKSQIHANDSQLTNSIIPKFGLYKHLLNIMLEAKQPVLLAGEPSSGKTTLCNTLSFERPHINLPASPLLSSREFRIILKNCCHKNWNNNVGSVKKEPGLLLFVDDLHEAPRDVFGKVSAALETLRQSISQEQIGMFDTYFFKALSSKTVSYMATSCVFTLSDPVRNAVSSRLSRLFSIFVLPSLSKDVLLSIHSPWMKIWLKEMSPSHSGEKMSNRIITATKNVYESVCAQFHPTSERPQLTFSHHDIQKVFSGMYLWQDDMSNTAFTEKNKSIPSPSLPVLPGLPASDLKIVHLWIHECMRTFSDRLCSEDERKTFLSVLVETADAHFGFNLLDNSQPDTSEAKEASQKFKSDHTPTKSTNISSRETNFKPQPVTPLHLKHYKAIETSLVYGPDFSETLMFLNPEHNFKDKRLYVKQDLDVIWPELLRLIDSKEEANHVDNIHNTVTRYSVHRQGVSQLLHIFRTLLIPGGHGVLIGSGRGTGRKTTVRLAAYLTGCQLMEVRSNNENKVHETLKEAGNQTDKNGVNVIILVHEDISSPVREEILIAMAQKVFPGHCTEDELSSLVSRVTAMECVERYHMGRWISEKVLSQIHKNVHVFLLMPFNMSSDENTQSFNTQMAKAVKLSCCVEVYQPWSNQSWVEIAVQNLKLCSSEMFRGCSEDSLSVAMAAIYQSAHQYASIFLETQPFSPRTYTEFIAFFSYFCNQLPKQWVNKNNRVSSALARMDVLNNEVGKWKEQILRLQKETENKQQLHKMHLKAVDDKKNLLQLASKTCEAKKNKLNQLEEKIHQVQKLIKPVLLSGLKILQCLKPSDFEEVRHYRDPPDGVVKIMDAVCLLFNRPPGWESAKQLIMQPDFFQEMEFYDYQSLTKAQLQQLGQIAHSPLFVPESVQEVSKACESLCRWVQAVCEFCSMQHHLVVKQQLEVQAREAQNQLLSAEKHKKEVRQLLEHAEFQLQSMESELEDLMLQLYETEAEEEEATLCAAKLEMHVKNWRGAFQVAETRFQNTPGDALLLAAVVSYFGPFEPHLRTELVSKWKELCWTGSIDMNPKDLRTSLFTPVDSESAVPSLGFPIAVTERLQLPVDQTLGITDWQLEDVLPARLMVKLMLWGLTNACMQRWPLLADTEQHLQISSLNWSITGVKVTLEEELRCRLVVCADDSKLLDKLDHASEEGWRVLITHLERATPSPEFMARLTRPVDCRLPGLQQISSDSPQTVNPEFCLFLSTNLPVRLLSSGIHPSILAQLFVVDLSLSSEEIQELMLTQLLQSEHRELLIQHRRYQNYNQFLQKKLVSKEDALIDCTLQSDTSLQKDSNFLSCVAVCQEEMKEVQAEIKLLSEELKHHESLLAAPRQLMKLAAALYQALQAVARLSPGYIFSLHEFINVMQDAFSVKYRPLVPYKPGKAAESMLPELMNSMVLQLLVQYRPCLFKKHFAVLKLLVSLAVLQHNQLCSEAEKLAFLRGLGDVEQPVAEVQTQTFSSNLPSWIPPDIHSELFTLENIPSFRGLIASLHTSPIQWQEYIQFTSSTVTGPVPCCSHSHLFLLQRALLWKTILPSSLEKVADAIAVCSLCLPEKTAESPHSGNLKALSRYLTKNKGPIILAFPNPDEDTWIGIQPLHIINQMACCVGNEHEVYVKVICFGEQCDTEIILSTMDEAISEGHWLVFNNCHLLDHWTDNVVAHLSQLISFTEENPEIHPDFKLWFVTQENASHFLPAAVRMCAQLLVCDSPWDLREELSCSLQHVDWVSQPQSSPRVSDDNMEMLVRCAIFHSVLMQRQNYRSLGFGRIYHWSQEDLLGLIDAYICIASLCHDKTNVLQFIAVNLLHGSYVTDSADSEVVEKIAKTLFTTESSLSGSGPHMISDLISSCGRLDLSRSLQVLEKHFQDPAVSDPVLLGLSVDVAPEITRINSHHLNLLLQASQSPLGAMRSFSTEQNQLVKPPDYNHAAERLQALKKYLSLREDSTIRNVGTLSRSPLRNFLEAEWNDLIDLVSSLLLQLQRPVQYASSFSSPLNSCDLSWLEKRAKLLSAYCWSDSSSDPPGAYRLSAFKNPRGFLVALIREGAHKYYKYSSDIILQFQVLSKDTNPAVLPPDAVYLCGLELRGASWDTEQGVLQEAVFPQPVLMPLLCVKAGVRSRDSAAEPLSSCSYLMDSGNLQVESVSQQTALPAYYCPLYVNQEEEIGNSGLSDINIITKVPLYTQISPVLCSLRRVRLVCAL
uniref:Si:dkey-11m19.5 n=1 Tax=Nothobranchius furzeri TaxID=105023 RepID=A0A8C6KV71_NOTFU